MITIQDVEDAQERKLGKICADKVHNSEENLASVSKEMSIGSN